MGLRALAKSIALGKTVGSRQITKAAYGVERRIERALGGFLDESSLVSPGSSRVLGRPFHATPLSNIDAIMKEGLMVTPGQAGPGAYMGTIDKALHFAENNIPGRATGIFNQGIIGIKPVSKMTLDQRRTFVQTFHDFDSASQKAYASLNRSRGRTAFTYKSLEKEGMAVSREFNTKGKSIPASILEYMGPAKDIGHNFSKRAYMTPGVSAQSRFLDPSDMIRERVLKAEARGMMRPEGSLPNQRPYRMSERAPEQVKQGFFARMFGKHHSRKKAANTVPGLKSHPEEGFESPWDLGRVAETKYTGPVLDLPPPPNAAGAKRLGLYGGSVDRARGLFSKLTKSRMGWIAGAVGVGYLLFSDSSNAQTIKETGGNLFSSVFHPFARRSEYVSSSALGVTDTGQMLGHAWDPRVRDILDDSDPARSFRLYRSAKAGNYIHSMIQRELLEAGAASEVERYVEDPKNKVFGYIDAVLTSGIPLEIKTIADNKLANLSRPKATHVSQANFYALSQGVNMAKIMYVSRESPSKRKVFTVSADPGRYINDLSNIRAVQARTSLAPSTDPYLKGFRPLNSWFGGGINHNMPYSRKSTIRNQRARLSSLPVSQHMPQQVYADHPNQSRQGLR